MIRKLFFTVLLLLLIPFNALAFDVYFDGEKADFTVDTGMPIAENSTVLLPLYKSAELIGASVLQDNPNGTAVISRDGVSVSCDTGSTTVYRNGSGRAMQYGLVWRGGPLYIDARLLSLFDCDVYVGKESAVITSANNSDKGDVGCRMYISTNDLNYKATKYYGVRYEPRSGMYLGADFSEDKKRLGALETAAGKDVCALKIRISTMDELYSMADSIKATAHDGGIIYCVLEESAAGIGGSLENSENYVKIAKLLEGCGGNLLVCLGENPNCEHTKYGDSQGYIKRYRSFAGIFRDHAPSVATVFSLCSLCEGFTEYYPGDMYADFIGVSLCDGKESSCTVPPTKLIDRAISHYSYKKPVIISSPLYGYSEKYSEYSKKPLDTVLLDTYCRITLSYPCIKAAFLFENPEKELTRLSEGSVRSAVSTGLNSCKRILSRSDLKSGIADNSLPDVRELSDKAHVPGDSTVLYAMPDVEGYDLCAYYSVNGEETALSEAVPYGAVIDLSQYRGKEAVITVSFKDGDGKVVSQKSVTLFPDGTGIDTEKAKNDVFSELARLIMILVLVIGIITVSVKINKILKM